MGCCFCTSLGLKGVSDRQGVLKGRYIPVRLPPFIGVFGAIFLWAVLDALWGRFNI